MAEPYLGEIKLWAFNWAPKDWAICDGRLLSINQNQALYSLLGTTYGGDGRTNFALPDLRGRIAVGWDYGATGQYNLGARYGFEDITLSTAQMPAHNHGIRVNATEGDRSFPDDDQDYFSNNAADKTDFRYASPNNNITTLSPETMPTSAGGGLSHTNIQPSIVGNYCISLKGVFPSRN